MGVAYAGRRGDIEWDKRGDKQIADKVENKCKITRKRKQQEGKAAKDGDNEKYCNVKCVRREICDKLQLQLHKCTSMRYPANKVCLKCHKKI